MGKVEESVERGGSEVSLVGGKELWHLPASAPLEGWAGVAWSEGGVTLGALKGEEMAGEGTGGEEAAGGEG